MDFVPLHPHRVQKKEKLLTLRPIPSYMVTANAAQRNEKKGSSHYPPSNYSHRIDVGFWSENVKCLYISEFDVFVSLIFAGWQTYEALCEEFTFQ